MPTYEYECTHCAHAFEKFQSMKDKPVQRCPKCRHKVRKLVGAGAGIIFKGSGFYETDYKRKPIPPASETKSASTEPKSSSASSESKSSSSSSDRK